jgi:hypothetical protein
VRRCSEDTARTSVRVTKVGLKASGACSTRRLTRRCALTGAGPTGTLYGSTSDARVGIFQHRRTPYTCSSVVRVHTSVSSPCLARRRDEPNQTNKLITLKHTRPRVPSHRSHSLSHFAFKPRRRVPSSKSTNAMRASHTKKTLAMHETTLRIFTSLRARGRTRSTETSFEEYTRARSSFNQSIRSFVPFATDPFECAFGFETTIIQ